MGATTKAVSTTTSWNTLRKTKRIWWRKVVTSPGRISLAASRILPTPALKPVDRMKSWNNPEIKLESRNSHLYCPLPPSYLPANSDPPSSHCTAAVSRSVDMYKTEYRRSELGSLVPLRLLQVGDIEAILGKLSSARSAFPQHGTAGFATAGWEKDQKWADSYKSQRILIFCAILYDEASF